MFRELKLRQPFERLSLTRQFLLISAAVLVVGMAVIGSWVGRQIETNAIHHATSMAAIYVQSILMTQPRDWSNPQLDAAAHDELDRLFLTGPLERAVVRLKFWHRDGTIFYSNDHAEIGQRLGMSPMLVDAFRGKVLGQISDLEGVEHADERKLGLRLLEVFVPVHAPDRDDPVAVAEFYYTMEGIDRDIGIARQRTWWVVGLSTVVMWLLLIGLVRRADNTIAGQQRALRAELARRDVMLAENAQMQERLREAGARSTALNENFVQRTAANLHDGPAQDLALALLRFEAVAEPCDACNRVSEQRGNDIVTLRAALNSALEDLRTIASDLRMPPGIDHLSLAETAGRAVRDFEQKYGQTVRADIASDTDAGIAPMAAKITAYRMIQEALANGWWHARGSPQEVSVSFSEGRACIEVSDRGPGFDMKQAADSGRLGLALLSERVQLLSGTIAIDSSPGKGTRIIATLPLSHEDTTIA